MEYLVRFSQSHETFRLAEIQALATLEGLDLEIVSYDPESPFCVVSLADDAAAARLVHRSVLVQSIHSLWGRGATLDAFRDDVRRRAAPLWPAWRTATFKMGIDSFRGKRTAAARLALIDSFADLLPLEGDIDLRDPAFVLTVFEQWPLAAVDLGIADPDHYYLGRRVAVTARGDTINAFDLKARRYIATTSMDAELSLVTANLALAGPGKLFYDPFVGTGSFPLAAAHCGAVAWGSDIDGRAVRGSAAGINGSGGSGGARTGRADVRGNFEHYGLLARFGDVFAADLTHAPLCSGACAGAAGARRWIDGIVCDPPYGVREGPRVLGVRNADKKPWIVEAGKTQFKDPSFIHPKQPYSFLALLDDLLRFAADTLVDDGRLAFWMPTANDQAQELPIPTHPCLEIVSVSKQVFTRWSRRLITYRRLPDADVDAEALAALVSASAAAPSTTARLAGQTADDLNPFRRGYFRKFQRPEEPSPTTSPSPAAAKKPDTGPGTTPQNDTPGHAEAEPVAAAPKNAAAARLDPPPVADQTASPRWQEVVDRPAAHK